MLHFTAAIQYYALSLMVIRGLCSKEVVLSCNKKRGYVHAFPCYPEHYLIFIIHFCVRQQNLEGQLVEDINVFYSKDK